jgi:hypothetical protein
VTSLETKYFVTAWNFVTYSESKYFVKAWSFVNMSLTKMHFVNVSLSKIKPKSKEKIIPLNHPNQRKPIYSFKNYSR